MTRRLLNFFTALSLLLCAALVGLWVHSYSRRLGIVTWNPTGGRASLPGRISFLKSRTVPLTALPRYSHPGLAV